MTPFCGHPRSLRGRRTHYAPEFRQSTRDCTDSARSSVDGDEDRRSDKPPRSHRHRPRRPSRLPSPSRNEVVDRDSPGGADLWHHFVADGQHLAGAGEKTSCGIVIDVSDPADGFRTPVRPKDRDPGDRPLRHCLLFLGSTRQRFLRPPPSLTATWEGNADRLRAGAGCVNHGRVNGKEPRHADLAGDHRRG